MDTAMDFSLPGRNQSDRRPKWRELVVRYYGNGELFVGLTPDQLTEKQRRGVAAALASFAAVKRIGFLFGTYDGYKDAVWLKVLSCDGAEMGESDRVEVACKVEWEGDNKSSLSDTQFYEWREPEGGEFRGVFLEYSSGRKVSVNFLMDAKSGSFSFATNDDSRQYLEAAEVVVLAERRKGGEK